MKAIVTGASGYIGQNLVPTLISHNYDVTCIIRDKSKVNTHSWHSQVKLIQYDGTFSSLANGINSQIFPEEDTIVFHLASLASYDCPPDNISAMINSNITFGTHLLEAMKQCRITKIVNTGTYWQYSSSSQYDPVCLYAATKEAFENIITVYVNTTKISCITLILFDVYGPFDPRGKLIKLFNESSKTNQPIKLSPGLQKKDMVYISDVTNAFVSAATNLMSSISKKNRKYAVCTKERMTIREFASLYEDVMSVKLDIHWGAMPYREKEIINPWDPSPQEILPNWEAKINIREGLALIKNIEYQDNDE